MKNKILHKSATFLSLILIVSCFVLGPALFVYIIDPFQIYHKSIFKNAEFSTEQSYQHAGWINRLLADPGNNYQSIVIGSSTMANYSQTLINEHLPWGNTLNLSVNGSTPWMQHKIAKYALEKNPHIKHILWDIHLFYVFNAEKKRIDKEELKFPDYLYNDKIWDDAPYLFNQTNIETGLKFIAGDFSQFSGDVENNGPFYKNLLAEGRFEFYGSQQNRRDTLLPQLQQVDFDHQLPDKSLYLKHAFSSVDNYLLDVILPLCNSDTDINITFSPATRFYYASIADINFFDNQVWMRRYIVERTQTCKNIKVFAFDNLDWIVNNLHNYADNFHYSININNYIIESIAKNENRLTVDNIDQYENQFIHNVDNYRNSFLMNLDKP